MDAFFDIVSGKITVRTEILALPTFKAVWDLDTSKTKDSALRDFTFLYHFANHRSPYAQYTNEAERIVEVNKEVYKTVSKKIPEHLKDVIELYNKLSKTVSLRLLKASRHACNEMSEFFEQVKSKDMEPRDVKELAMSIEKVGKIQESLDKLEKKVASEESENRMRGKDKKGFFEDPNTWKDVIG